MNRLSVRGISPSRLIYAAACSVLAFLVVAPAHAHAQLSTSQLDGATSQVTDTGSQLGGTTTSTVGSVTKTVEETVKDPVKETGSTLTDTTTKVGGAVDSTTSTVKKTVDDAGSTVTKTVDGTGSTVTKTVDGAASGVTTTSGKTVDKTVGGLTPRDEAGGSGSKSEEDGRETRSGGSDGMNRSKGEAPSGSFVLPDRLNPVAQIPQAAIPVLDTTPAASREDTSAWADAIRRALRSAEKFAFPLALTLLVVAYLAFQGWMDRQDPKLALAAADPEADLLSFE